MGRISQICGLDSQTATTTTNSKPKVERKAFEYANGHLANMGGCSEGDLCQAFKSYFFQYLRESGASDLFREAEVEAKAARAGAWWSRKFKKRPHSKYSPEQTKRGHQVSRFRRGATADLAALVAQLQQQKGVKVVQIADDLEKTLQHTRRLLRRKFSKLLVLMVVGTFANSPLPSLPVFDTEKGQKEYLANVPIDADREEQDEIERLGPQIGDILRQHWRERRF